MNRWRQFLFLLSLSLATSIMLGGCTAWNTSMEDAIIGKWELVSGGDLKSGETLQFEFLKGGNVIATGKDWDSFSGKVNPASITGNYEFIDDNRIRFDFGGVNAEIDTVSISGNEMVLTDPKGAVSKFRKIQYSSESNAPFYSGTGEGTVTDVAGNQYQAVKIGSQTWMAKNLDVSTFKNGDPIPEVKTDAEWEAAGSAKKPAWSYYDHGTANGKTYGGLYNWYAVNDPRGLCPKGWHVPTDDEWDTLVSFLGDSVAGNKMKEAGTAHWESPNTGATNASGFSVLPGGNRYLNGYSSTLGIYAYFWSAAESSSGSAWSRNLNSNNSDVYRNNYYKAYGFSVRCVRD